MRLDELSDMQHLVPMRREGGLPKAHAPLSNTTYYYIKKLKFTKPITQN